MDITEIIVAFIGVLTAIITSVIVPWLKSKIAIENQEIITTTAKIAVYAAQQVLHTAEDKKDYAVNYVSNALNYYGIKLSTDEISTHVEAALKEVKTSVDTNIW